MTNADRIRAMTDEELAALLAEGCHGTRECPSLTNASYNKIVKSCKNCWLSWMAEEVKDGKPE